MWLLSTCYFFLFFFLSRPLPFSSLFFFNDTATTEIYTLSLHDALPISLLTTTSRMVPEASISAKASSMDCSEATSISSTDRKSTRLNSSHLVISYAVFCLKKKKINKCYGAITVRIQVDSVQV